MIKKIKHFLRLTYLYVVTRIIFLFKHSPKVLDSLTSIKYINDYKLSISRYGDGEFMIINGKSIKFQEYDEELSKKLKEILFIKEDKFQVCIPEIYKFKTTRRLKYDEEIFWLEQIKNYSDIYLNKQYKKKVYYDSCISRFYIRYKKNKISKSLLLELKKLWDNQEILIVEGKYSRSGVGNDLFQNTKTIRRILCPNQNAFQYYDKIKKEIIKNYNGELVLLALGPTATVLAYELHKAGIRALDMGHLDLEYEWYLSNSKEKNAITNKIVNEIEEPSELSEIKEKTYLDSIVSEIK